MRFYALCAALLFASTTAFAKNNAAKKADPSGVQPILSFYQWADLSEKKRIEYIEGLQRMHLNLERGRSMRGLEVGQAPAINPSWVHQLLEMVGPVVARAADPESCQLQSFTYHKNSEGRICTYYDKWYNIGQYTYCSHNSPQELRNYAQMCPEKFEKFVADTRASLSTAENMAFSVSAYAARGGPPPAEERRQKDDDASVTPPAASEVEKDKPAEPRCSRPQIRCEMQTMSSKSLDEYRQEYRKAMEERTKNGQKAYCAVGGFVSELNSRKKCSPVTTFKIGTGWSGSCSSGKTMCNPMIFGFQENGKPFCAPLAQMVTSECWSQAVKAGNKPKKIQDQLLGKTSQTEKIGLDSMADAWRDFRVRMVSLCEPGPSLEFHCNECNAMSLQVASMNMGSTCADRCGVVDPNISEEACRTSYKSRSSGDGGEAGTPGTH